MVSIPNYFICVLNNVLTVIEKSTIIGAYDSTSKRYKNRDENNPFSSLFYLK